MKNLKLILVLLIAFSMNTTLTWADDADRIEKIKWLDGCEEIRTQGIRPHNKNAIILVKDSEYIIVDNNGNLVANLKYDKVYNFEQGLAKVVIYKNGIRKYGFIDEKGKEIVPVEHDRVWELNDGMILANKNGKFGYYNDKGENVIPFKLLEAEIFSEGLASVRFEKKSDGDKKVVEQRYTYINKKGDRVMDEEFVWTENFSEGLALVCTDHDSKPKYIDKTGKTVIQLKSLYGGSFSEGLASIRVGEPINGSWGFIDRKGKKVIKEHFKSVDAFKNGMAIVFGDDLKQGLINKKGEIVLPIQNDKIVASENGYIYKKDNKYGYIHKNGKIVPAKYSIPFGYNVMSINDKIGYIDSNGNIKIPKNFDLELMGDDEVSLIAKDRKFGYAINGKVVIEPMFEKASLYKNEVAVVRDKGKIGIINKDLLFGIGNQNEGNTNFDAIYSNMNIKVNNQDLKDIEIYNIKGNNYFKLRDIAKISMNKKSEFSVGWDKNNKLISIKKGEKYTPIGQEMVSGDKQNKKAVKSTANLKVGEKIVDISSYNVNGNNFYKLRDLGEKLDFEVKWEEKTRTVVVNMQ